MFKYITVLYFTAIGFAQAQSNFNVEKSQLQLGLPLPGVLYELGTSKNTTLSFEALAGFELRGCSGCDTDFGIYPIVRGQYRYYYNMERRLRKQKNISGNSGNYVAALVGYQHGSPLIGNLNTVNTLGIGPVYGLQRTYRKGFFYRLEGGVAYFQDDFDEGVGLVLAARIGWVIGRKNRK